GFAPSSLCERWRLFAPSEDGRCAPALLQPLPHFVIVRAFRQTPPRGGLRRRGWPLHGAGLAGGPRHLKIMPMRSVHGQPDGDTAAVGAPAALGAPWAAVGRLLAHLLPPKGGLGQGPTPREPLPGEALHGVVVHQALFP